MVKGSKEINSETMIGQSSCITENSGICQVSQTTRGTSLMFTVTNIVLSGFGYDSAANGDADGDDESTGRKIGR